MLTLAAFADEAAVSLDGQIKALNENDIGYIELRGVDGKNVSQLSRDEIKTVKRRLDGAGVKVWSVGSPIGKTQIDDPFDAERERFLRALDAACVLQCRRMRIFSFYHDNVPFGDGLFDEVCDRLRYFASEAEECGVILCCENEKGVYGDTAERSFRIHEALPQIKVVFDPCNFAVCGEQVMPSYRQLEKYVDYLHVKDCDENGVIVPAGRGICQIRQLCRAYEQNGGEVITAEPHLFVFDGLSSLEKDGERSHVDGDAYSSPRAAFDIAVSSIKNIITEL